MKNWTFKQWNTILGWVVFVIAFITYLSTIEPNFSFWDCGEYISSAVKLRLHTHRELHFSNWLEPLLHYLLLVTVSIILW
jgi:hypothetical protein